ncbi:MAG TPA: acyl-ACP thioesterase domain-containing protein [Bacteroidales bacterium]|nr:acyl-ACP thioesterase domain-containing protein [Bacteroidales bacterium]
MIVFERKYSVNVFDTDLTGRMSLGSLFNYFQDLAGRHASVLGFGREHLMTNGFIWVLSRMTVEIERLPLSWEEVTVRTWPRGTDTIFAIRDLEMYDSDNKRIAAASSSWVIIDYNTRKVQRPDKALSFLNATFPETKALASNAAKVPLLPADNRVVSEMVASLGDIDVNHHVNNARYIFWVTGTYEPEFITAHAPGLVEVNYLAEGYRGDKINIITAPENGNGNTFIHTVVRNNDNCELCRIRIQWREQKL